MSTPLFVAVGQDGLRLASTDGVTWSHRQTGKEGESYRSAAAGRGLMVAVGSYGGDNIVAATADGKVWKTAKREAKYVQYLRGLAFGNDQFLGLGGDPGSVGSSRPFVLLSQDGIAWDRPFEIPGKHILRRAAWGNKRFVAVGDRGRRATSADGKTWVDAREVKAIDTLVDITFGKDRFVGVGLHGLRMSSKDGLEWTAPIRGEEGEHLNSVMFANDRFVAVGAGATYFSPDGERWERVPNHHPPQLAAFGAGTFIGSAWKGRLLRSTDAVTWTESFKSDLHVEAIAFGTVG